MKCKLPITKSFDIAFNRREALRGVIEDAEAAARLNIPFTITTENRSGCHARYKIVIGEVSE